MTIVHLSIKEQLGVIIIRIINITIKIRIIMRINKRIQLN